jgi:hypothetical protein
MRKAVLITALCMFLGCGHEGDGNGTYDFTGSWSGIVSTPASTCSEGTTLPADSSDFTFDIKRTAPGQLSWSSKCGTFYLTQRDNIATQNGTLTCPPTVTGGSQITYTYRDVSLVLNLNALQVDITADMALAGGGKTVSCNGIRLSGTLLRQ